jgi:response regulator NasT
VTTISDQPTRVVIAEDEAIIRLDLKELLEEEGFNVVGETGRGDEAVDLVRSLEPELAILDIKMPGLDGLSAARQIAGERLAAVLILTAFSQRDLVEQARDAGAMSYIVKPFQKSDLIPAIEVALGRHAELKSLEAEVGDLTERLEARKTIDRAKGVLMDQHGLSEGDAWRFLQREAMNRRTKVHEVAALVVTGDLSP